MRIYHFFIGIGDVAEEAVDANAALFLGELGKRPDCDFVLSYWENLDEEQYQEASQRIAVGLQHAILFHGVEANDMLRMFIQKYGGGYSAGAPV